MLKMHANDLPAYTKVNCKKYGIFILVKIMLDFRF